MEQEKIKQATKSEIDRDYLMKNRIVVGQTILIELKDGKRCLCLAGGSSSGIFEVKSITGDGMDLVNAGLFKKLQKQYQIGITKISRIVPVSIDVLGKIH